MSSSSSSSSSVSSLESDSVDSGRLKDAYDIVKAYYEIFSVKAVETAADVAARKKLLAESVTHDFLDCFSFDIPKDCDTLQSDLVFLDRPVKNAQNYHIKSLTVADDVVTVVGIQDFFNGTPNLNRCNYPGRVVSQELAVFKIEGNKIKQVLYSASTVVGSLSVASTNC